MCYLSFLTESLWLTRRTLNQTHAKSSLQLPEIQLRDHGNGINSAPRVFLSRLSSSCGSILGSCAYFVKNVQYIEFAARNLQIVLPMFTVCSEKYSSDSNYRNSIAASLRARRFVAIASSCTVANTDSTLFPWFQRDDCWGWGVRGWGVARVCLVCSCGFTIEKRL